MDEKTLEFYQQQAKEIAERYRTAHDGIRRHFAEAFPTPPQRILDIGCGSGKDVAILLSMGHEAFGTEPAANLRQEAVQAFPNLSGRLFPHSLPIPSEANLGDPFDGVICSAVLMHLAPEDHGSAAASIRQRLKPRGSLLISIPGKRPDLDTAHRDSHHRLFTPISKNDCLALFQRHSFSLLKSWETKDALEREGVTWLTFLFSRAD